MSVKSGLFNADCRDFMDTMSEEWCDLMITSPPYNVGIEYDNYDDKQEYENYLKFLYDVFSLVYIGMKKDSVICVNIGRNYQVNTPSHIAKILEDLHFNFYCSIIWKKPVGSAVPSAMCQPNFPKYLPYCVTEDILIFTKGKMPNFIPDDEVMRLRRKYLSNVWEILPEFNTKHPAVMPRVMAYNLIIFFSKPGDVVYDPFCGAGTTLAMAKQAKRVYVGTEISKKYCEIFWNKERQVEMF